MSEHPRGVRQGLGIALTLVGLVIGLFALWKFTDLGPASTDGVDDVEASLSTEEARPDVATSTTAANTHVEPLWKANTSSQFPEPPVDRREPTRLVIPSLQVDAPIGSYGVEPETNQMEIPNSAREVAWYRFGPSPGELGSAVLAAHVDLRSQGRGVFFDLDTMAPGDVVTVEFDDGSTLEFVVNARAVYPKEELPLDTVFSRQGAPVLTLITCGGGFSESERSYDSNVVVYALPAESA